MMIFWLFCIVIVAALVIVWKRMRRKVVKSERVSLMVVAGSGGHTTEILRLVSALPADKYSPRIYVLAESDKSSEDKIAQTEQELLTKNASTESHEVVRVSRSREVGQSWLTTVFTTAKSTLNSFPIVFRWKPDLLLCNGPGTCIPLCAVAKLFKVLFGFPTRVVYVESICRVYDLSLSGKILYRFADYLLVQWPELHRKYPKTIYLGRFY